MGETIRVAQYGLGPIGLECVRSLLDRAGPGLELVGAIDTDAQKAGQDVASLAGRPEPCGVVVGDDVERVLAETRPDVVLHTTTSFLADNHEQFEACATAKAHVVSSTEELLWPWDRHAELARRLDATAREHGVAFLGTGVNPGFVMDTLAVVASYPCRSVESIKAERVVDASKRRLPLQRKVGAGLTADEFAARKRAGKFGHIGLVESARFLAAGLGWTLERMEEHLDPVIAASPVESEHFNVRAGQVAGIHHVVRGRVDGGDRIELDLKMYVGARDPHDGVHVGGDPPVDLVIRGGVFGDTATVATLINAAPLIRRAEPGLRTLLDLPLPRVMT